MRLELTMSTKDDEDVFKNCIEEIIEEGFTLNTIRNNAQKVKSIIRIEENPEFQKGIASSLSCFWPVDCTLKVDFLFFRLMTVK